MRYSAPHDAFRIAMEAPTEVSCEREKNAIHPAGRRRRKEARGGAL
jgi:hypothetical protein